MRTRPFSRLRLTAAARRSTPRSGAPRSAAPRLGAPRLGLGAQLLIAWQGVRRRPLRNALTATSLLVGVLTIVLIQGANSAMGQAILLDAVLDRGPATTVRVGLRPGPEPAEAADRWRGSLASLTGDVRGRTAVVVDQPRLLVRTPAGTVGNLTVQAVDPALRDIRPFPLLHGSWFGPATLAPQLVLNRAAWEAGGWSDGTVRLVTDAAPAPAGSGPGPTTAAATAAGAGRATAGVPGESVTARVVGVVQDGNKQPNAYLGLVGDGPWRATAYRTGSVSVLVQSAALSEQTLHDRITGLAERADLAGELTEVERIDRVADFDAQLATGRRLFLAIAALSLLVGSLGILNVGLATLRERSDELSLRRSFGATRGQVVRLMVLESQLVAFGAAAVAIVLAVAGAPLVLDRLGSGQALGGAGIPFSAMATGLVASALAALLGALAPTVRAALVPIASIMR